MLCIVLTQLSSVLNYISFYSALCKHMSIIKHNSTVLCIGKDILCIYLLCVLPGGLDRIS